jgi:hypothetical protein
MSRLTFPRIDSAPRTRHARPLLTTLPIDRQADKLRAAVRRDDAFNREALHRVRRRHFWRAAGTVAMIALIALVVAIGAAELIMIVNM